MRNALSFGWASAVSILLDVVLGSLWFCLEFTLIAVGFATIPVLGLGIVPLAAGIALTRISGPSERLRRNALLETTVPPVARSRTTATGWRRPLAQTWNDVRDPVTWRILLGHLLTMVVGTVFFGIVWTGTLAALGLIVGSPNLFAEALLDATEAAPGARIPLGIAILAAVAVAVYCGGLVSRTITPLFGPSSAVELRTKVDSLAGARQGAVDAAAIERQRIERDLHDGAQPRLVAMAMTLGMAKAKFDSDPEAARAMLETAHGDAKAAITELRQLARGIHPAVLTDRGLDAALSALAARTSVPTTVDVRLERRLPGEIEGVVYFAIAEALTNVSKHSDAANCAVVVGCRGAVLTATVTDDGRGGATGADGTAHGELGQGGLAGIAARVRSAGGTMTLDSPNGGPTTLTLELPCAS
ncbi:sensor histidine kinase [Agromyces subbeticus]|uniref:sensor histidine kinase n=1 Tax=Agromyces subbeticus TaxID=293890 RepID=UPI0003B66E14|nr:histidine kinase [Agromyces subbeticus]